jgi:hypothetical protein
LITVDDRDVERVKETLRRVESNHGFQWFFMACLFAIIMIVMAGS